MKTTTTTPASEETTVLQNTENQSSKSNESTLRSRIWKSVLIGGIPGIALGAAGTALAAEARHHDEPVTPDTPDNPSPGHAPEVPEDVTLAISVNDDMSFGEAFSAARAEVGAGGVFEWHGELYSTYTQGEWSAMTDEQKTEFADGVSEVDVPHEEASVSEEPQTSNNEQTAEENQDTPQENVIETTEPSQEEEHPSENQTTSQSQGDTSSAEDPSNNNATPAPEVTAEEFEHHGVLVNENGEPAEVEVLDAGRMDIGDGASVAVVEAHVDGHDAAFIDVDNDGYVDVIAVDANDDGEAQEGEMIDAQGSDMQMTELASADALGYDTPEEDLFAGMPDYTNDADVSSLA